MNKPTTEDQRLKVAADWFAKNQSTDVHEDDCADFLLWLQSDPDNEVCYAQLESTWQASAVLATDETFCTSAEASKPYTRHWLYALVGVAASVLLTLGLWLHYVDGIYSTRLGEQKLVVLEDHSTLRLNTDTKLKVKLTRDQRRVYLLKGEAIFSVAHDKSRPFIVEAGNHITTALGTEFNIQQYNSQYTVTVLEGSVKVAALDDATTAENPVLVAGQEVSYSAKKLTTPETANLNRIVAWQAGKLDFDAESLINVVSEVNRYSHKKIILGTPELEQLLISGTFRIGNVQAVVLALAETLPLWVVESADEYTLNPLPSTQKAEPAMTSDPG